jgi:signal transduction histidine kinase
VIRNLVENALKFSPEGAPVSVTVRADGGGLTIEVADRGPGMAAEELERIFDRFYQVGGSMRRQAQGVGLGLYISRWIVEALGGTIGVASEPGAGTTFTVSLPIDAVAEAATG